MPGVTVRLTYEAIYEYDDVVLVNDNVLKVFPRREDWQDPLDSSLETNPPGRVIRFRDRYGNPAARVVVRQPHTRIEFRAVSTVRLTRPYSLSPAGDHPLPLPPASLPAEVRVFLNPSPLVDPERLAGKAGEVAGPAPTLRGALESVVEWVYKNIEYARGYTTVKTRAHEVLEIGKGVCQDKAHLAIGLLRALGVPARYVSGALTDTPGETHAWLEAYWPGAGWVPADPTHGRVYDLGYYYVKFAHGRDYSDVPPVNGHFISRSPGRIKKVRVTPEVVEGELPPPRGSHS